MVIKRQETGDSFASLWESRGKRFDAFFKEAAETYDVPYDLLRWQAYVESRFDPLAYNIRSGAAGIMQIVPRWHPGVDVYDPREAILYAARYDRELFDRFGSWAAALAAYNWGPGNLERQGWQARPRETVAYVETIMSGAGLA